MKLAITTLSGSAWPAYRFQIVTVKGSLGAFSLYGSQKKTMSKYMQPGIKANEAPTYPLLQGNECT